ncbi:SAM-dependent methyltransferase [Curtobacterium sp. VKM Ac-2922]|uniref:SAM-dependent methyltransferase n=1 Tax=Curtobacterium sp. VKM Ac-2922 TaxID=2929475 RepID=UPI001FB1F011|nr:SAM-dependent methyltransferase [Curtobacterium sp. VKM Ac-2922]MCJ1715262.1 SAM-dependent methyltransferase [Curtobacterium sp. VKM Ac-2922]
MSTPADVTLRRPEPAFVRAVSRAIGQVSTLLVVGDPGYAPTGPDATVIDGPSQLDEFADDSVDAALVAFALADWPDAGSGLAEVRRVTRGPVVVLTRDPDRIAAHWLAEYAPEVAAADAARHPAVDGQCAALGDEVTTERLPVPYTSVAGFAEAYYGRPERLLDAGTRAADPAWGLVDELTARRSVAALRSALETGAWDDRHGPLRVRPAYDGSVVLLTSRPRLEP